jgi:two-component system, chemotaxis family, sensor kinase CheA
MEDMQELIAEFITDCSENLEEFENNLLELEKNPNASNIVDSMFRQIHSIKGASGFLSFSKLESLTHKSENVLDLIRQSKGEVNQPLISTFLDVCDALKSIFETIQEQGNDGENNYPNLIDRLIQFETSFKSGEPIVVEEIALEKEESCASVNEDIQEEPVEDESNNFDNLDPVQIESLKALGLYNPDTLANLSEKNSMEEVTNMSKEVKVEAKTEAKKTTSSSAPTKVKETIRVDVDTLDHLVNLAGELVLIRNQILELSKNNSTTVFSQSFNNLDMITGEIQKSLMSTRMQPISVVWSKMPRIVRDLAAQLGRDIAIEMKGENTELDKSIIEAITDPMTHIIRNCCDHGIETPDERMKAGKKPNGTIKLSAEHRGNWIYVDVIDDGKGISRSVLKKKALEKGLFTQEELDNMDDQQILNIIFHAGFSTKDQASNISGRGVGMDVIRSNIQKINGNVEISSTEGKGTHLKIRLPLTLAIIPGVIVLINNERYVIPQNAVQEVAELKPQDIEELNDIAGQKFTRLRGQILPLVFSNNILFQQRNLDIDRTLNYVVINTDGYQYGLVIDKVTDIIEIVVKPLSSEQDFKYYAGATIMGDGRVALILDPSKIAELSKIDKVNLNDEDKEQKNSKLDDDLTLTFELNNKKKYLIPLNKTSRIEEIPLTSLDYRDIGIFAKFNNKVIRVIDLQKLVTGEDSFDKSATNKQCTIRVLYYEMNGHGIAVEVGHDQKLLREQYDIEACSGSEFVIGTTLIDEGIYEVLHLEEYLGKILGQESSKILKDTGATQSTNQSNNYIKLFDSKNSVISFRLNELLFGIRLDSVCEIINKGEITETPGSRTSVQGLLNLRGEIIISRELSKIFNINSDNNHNEDNNLAKNLIIKNGDKKVCVEIQTVNEIINLTEDQFNTTPSNIPQEIHSYLKGVYNLGQEMLLLLDEKCIINDIFALENNAQ